VSRNVPRTCVSGDILGRHEAAGFANAAGYRVTDRAAVIDVGTVVGERTNRARQLRLSYPTAGLDVAVVLAEIVEAEVLEHLACAVEEERAAARHREAFLGVVQGAPGDFAEAARPPLLEHREPAVDRAGHRDRMRPEVGHCVVAGLLAHGVRGRTRGCTTDTAVGVHRAVPHDREEIAAEPAHVGRDDAEREICRKRGVDRVPPVGEHRRAGRGGEVVRSRNRPVGIGPRFAQPNTHTARDVSLAGSGADPEVRRFT
jgi:hypothetical protein